MSVIDRSRANQPDRVPQFGPIMPNANEMLSLMVGMVMVQAFHLNVDPDKLIVVVHAELYRRLKAMGDAPGMTIDQIMNVVITTSLLQPERFE